MNAEAYSFNSVSSCNPNAEGLCLCVCVTIMRRASTPSFSKRSSLTSFSCLFLILQDLGRISTATDIYSFGVIMVRPRVS